MKITSYKQEVLRRIPEGFCVGAEVGVWRGGLSRYLLERRPKLNLILVDPWLADARPVHDQDDCDAAKEIVSELAKEFAGRVTIISLPSQEAVKQVESVSLDFFYLDAIHTREAINADMQVWIPKLKPSSWYGGRDFPDRWFGDKSDTRCGLAKAGVNRTWFVEAD